MPECLAEVAQLLGRRCDVVMRPRLAGPVGMLRVQIESLAEVAESFREGAKVVLGPAEITAGCVLASQGTEALGRCDRSVLAGDQVVPVALTIEEQRQCPRELPRIGVEAHVAGLVDRGQQDLALGSEPGQGVTGTADGLGGDPGLRWLQENARPGRV